MSQSRGRSAEGYIIEMRRIGGSVKVTAIDPESLTEASIVGPARAPNDLLTHRAVEKLNYVLTKNSRSPSAKDK